MDFRTQDLTESASDGNFSARAALQKSGGAEGVAQLRFGTCLNGWRRAGSSGWSAVARVSSTMRRRTAPRHTGWCAVFASVRSATLLSTTANSSPHARSLVPETFAWRLILERACQSLPKSFGASVFLGELISKSGSICIKTQTRARSSQEERKPSRETNQEPHNANIAT